MSYSYSGKNNQNNCFTQGTPYEKQDKNIQFNVSEIHKITTYL